MALAPDFAKLGVDLIAEFGSNVQLDRAVGNRGGTYDPSVGKASGGTPASQTVKALTENKGLWLGPGLGTVGSKKLTVAANALAWVPEPGDTFLHNAKQYTVMRDGVKATEVEGTPVLYEIYGDVGA